MHRLPLTLPSLSALLAAGALALCHPAGIGPAQAQPSSQPASTPGSGPVTSRPVTSQPVTSRPVTSTPVTSRPVTSVPIGPRALPPTPEPGTWVVGGGGATPADTRTSAAGAGTFAAPRHSQPPRAGEAIGTMPLPFAEPVIRADERRFPIAPDRPGS